MDESARSRADQKRHPGRSRRSPSRNWTKIAGTALGLILLAAIFSQRLQIQPPSPVPPALAEDPSLGPADAPVTIIEYGDFGCTTCRNWVRQGVLEQILANYGSSVRFVWRDFPIITAASPKAAEAGQCAFDQGQFWAYHDLLYRRAPALSVSDLKAYAAELGLDTQQFDTCLDSGVHQTRIEASTKEAYAHGFVATPAFLVNGQPIAGPQSFEYFKSVIDPLLATAGG